MVLLVKDELVYGLNFRGKDLVLCVESNSARFKKTIETFFLKMSLPDQNYFHAKLNQSEEVETMKCRYPWHGRESVWAIDTARLDTKLALI